MEQQTDDQPVLESRVKHFLIELIPGGSLYNVIREVGRNDKKLVSKYIIASLLDGAKAIAYSTPIVYLLSN